MQYGCLPKLFHSVFELFDRQLATKAKPSHRRDHSLHGKRDSENEFWITPVQSRAFAFFLSDRLPTSWNRSCNPALVKKFAGKFGLYRHVS
jgi:hypothetical protein